MSQSLSKLYVHLIFSSKHRQHIFTPEIQPDLYKYLSGICVKLECYPVKVGGYTDHVHVLCLLSPKISLMKLVEEIKKSSSRWMKTKGDAFSKFYWQNGYGAFSVNPTQISMVSDYIENQAIHHQKKNFQEEYLLFLKKYKIAYDEKYVWS